MRASIMIEELQAKIPSDESEKIINLSNKFVTEMINIVTSMQLLQGDGKLSKYDALIPVALFGSGAGMAASKTIRIMAALTSAPVMAMADHFCAQLLEKIRGDINEETTK